MLCQTFYCASSQNVGPMPVRTAISTTLLMEKVLNACQIYSLKCRCRNVQVHIGPHERRHRGNRGSCLLCSCTFSLQLPPRRNIGCAKVPSGYDTRAFGPHTDFYCSQPPHVPYLLLSRCPPASDLYAAHAGPAGSVTKMFHESKVNDTRAFRIVTVSL